MLRMVNRLMALSLGVHREQLEHRMGLTWPRPFLLRPLFFLFLGMLAVSKVPEVLGENTKLRKGSGCTYESCCEVSGMSKKRKKIPSLASAGCYFWAGYIVHVPIPHTNDPEVENPHHVLGNFAQGVGDPHSTRQGLAAHLFLETRRT